MFQFRMLSAEQVILHRKQCPLVKFPNRVKKHLKKEELGQVLS